MLWPVGRAEPSHQEEPPALTARCCCVHRRPGRFSNSGHRNVGPGTPPGLLTALTPLCCGHTAVLGGREILGFCWLEREVFFFAVGTSLLFLMDPSSGQERERVCSHFGSSRRPTLWLEFPLTFSPFKVCLCRGDQRVLSVSMVPDASNVSKDGWSSVPYGWTCGHSSHERLWFSSKCYRRCGAPEPNGSPSAPLAAAKAPRRDRKRGTRPMSKPSTLPEVNLAKVLDELKENEHFQCSEELAMQAKVEQAWEAEKHQKLQSAQFPRPSKTARLRWRRRKAAAEAGGGGKAKSCTNYKWKLTS